MVPLCYNFAATTYRTILQKNLMTQVHQLYKLQEIDVEIREKKQRLGEVLKTLNGPDWLLKARQRMDTAVAELQSLQAKHNTVNLELQSIRNKISNSENRLYSGKVTNPKELSDLQGEIESLGRRAAIVEDEELELLILIEDAETEKTAAEEVLAKAEARWVTDSAELQSEKDQLAVRLNHLISSRPEMAAHIDAASLQEYDQLMNKKKGLAIARVRGNMCLGCRVNISANKLKLAKEGRKEYCGGCGRIIFPY